MLYGYTVEGTLAPNLVRVELVPYFPDFEYTRFDFVLEIVPNKDIKIVYSKLDTSFIAALLTALNRLVGITPVTCDKTCDSCKYGNLPKSAEECRDCLDFSKHTLNDGRLFVKSCRNCDYCHATLSLSMVICSPCKNYSNWRSNVK
jgi:hypothetical protein